MNILNSSSTAAAQIFKDLSRSLDEVLREQRELGVISISLRPTPLIYRLSGEQVTRLEHDVEQRLRGLLRDADRLYEVGCGEWLILLPHLPSRAVLTLGMLKIDRVFADSSFPLDGMNIRIELNCGAAVGPEHGLDAVYLFQSARIASLNAQNKMLPGLIYQDEMEERQSDVADLERELRHAFNGQTPLELFLQPKISARSGRCEAAEALLRWQRGGESWVPPPVVTNLIQRLGLRKTFNRWLFNRAARILSELAEHQVELVVSINLSVSDLYDHEVPELIEQALATWHAAPQQLCVEITETEMVGDDESEAGVFDVLRRLRALGVKLSIDDFGTGFSGMERLKQTAVDEIKIDRSFVVDILNSERDRQIATSIIGLAHRLGIPVTAEGVEDADTIELLAWLGCDCFQGFYFSPALPVEEFIDWVNDYHLQLDTQNDE